MGGAAASTLGLRSRNENGNASLTSSSYGFSAPNEMEQMVFHCLAMGRTNSAFDYLVKFGSKININARYKSWTFLHHAVSRQDRELVRYLLSCDGVDVAPRLFNGDTPLHIACSRGNVNLAKQLISHGATLDGCSDNGNISNPVAMMNGTRNRIRQENLATQHNQQGKFTRNYIRKEEERMKRFFDTYTKSLAILAEVNQRQDQGDTLQDVGTVADAVAARQTGNQSVVTKRENVAVDEPNHVPSLLQAVDLASLNTRRKRVERASQAA